jgi:hypothetical protein
MSQLKMDLPDDFISTEDFLRYANTVFENPLGESSRPAVESSLSHSSGTSRSSSTLPAEPPLLNPDIGPTSTTSSLNSSSEAQARPLAAKPSRPSTQFANVRHLASGYEPYPMEIPGRLPDMRLGQRTRKGHRKSRQGCYNCKKRKIKVLSFSL